MIKVNGTSALLKEIPETFFMSTAMGRPGAKTTAFEPGSRPSPHTVSAGASILDFQPLDL